MQLRVNIVTGLAVHIWGQGCFATEYMQIRVVIITEGKPNKYLHMMFS